MRKEKGRKREVGKGGRESEARGESMGFNKKGKEKKEKGERRNRNGEVEKIFYEDIGGVEGKVVRGGRERRDEKEEKKNGAGMGRSEESNR